MTLILVVDDEQELCEGICDILELEGYQTRGAHNGQNALEVMHEFTPDLIISDIMMPKMDGYSFYEAVRKNQDRLAIPFIFLTAKDQRVDVRRGKKLGADAPYCNAILV